MAKDITQIAKYSDFHRVDIELLSVTQHGPDVNPIVFAIRLHLIVQYGGFLKERNKIFPYHAAVSLMAKTVGWESVRYRSSAKDS